MKTLLLTMLAAAAMMVASSSAFAGMSSGSELVAIDSGGSAVVSINQPTCHVTESSVDMVQLDSNGLWLATDYSKLSGSEKAMVSVDKDMSSSSNLYCFDSASRFCAAAF